MKKLVVVLFVAGSVAVGSPSSARQSPSNGSEAVPSHGGPHVDMSRKKYGAILPDAYYENLSYCESGKPLGAYHHTRTYTSSLGIAQRTAARWSGKRNLTKLTPRQLIRVADRIAFSGWDRPDGEHVWRVGPWGWGALKRNCRNLQVYICKSTHPKVQKWKRGC